MKLLINIILMAFAFYTNDGSNGRLYQDDWSEIGIGSNFTHYVAYNHQNDIVYVCFTGSPKQIRGYQGDGTLLYSKNVSVTVRPLFVDADGNLWTIDDPTDNNIRIYNADLSSETVWTLGTSILGGIAYLCITWDSEYVYLIGNNATTTYLRKYQKDNLNGGTHEWQVTANTGRVCDFCMVDKYDDVYVHDYNYEYNKFSKTDGSSLWQYGTVYYGTYCEETDSLFVPMWNDGTIRELNVSGSLLAESEDISAMYAASIIPDVNETYLYAGYMIGGSGTNFVATRFQCHNWTTPESKVDGKQEAIHNNYFIGDSTGYIHSKLTSGISREIYTSSDVQFAFKEQSAWGTAEADSSNVNGILTEGFGVNSKINFIDFLSGRSQRYKHYDDIRVNQKGVVYETDNFKTPAIKTQLDYFLYGIFQNVVETANGSNYQKTFTFPQTQPDFTVNGGKFYTVWAKQPVMNTSQRINDAMFSELSLNCAPDNEGILWIETNYKARDHTDLADPTGTVTYPDISEFFFYDLSKAQIDSTNLVLSKLKINIKNNAKRIGIDSGKFKTFCLPRYIIELEIQMLYDSLAQTLMSYAKNGTATSFEFQWGMANNDGYLNISGNAKISQAVNFDRQEENYVNVHLFCCGEYGVTEPFQIVMINSEDRGW